MTVIRVMIRGKGTEYEMSRNITCSKLRLKHVIAYWRMNNIRVREAVTDDSDTELFAFKPGYWSFDWIAKTFEDNGIELILEKNLHVTINPAGGSIKLGTDVAGILGHRAGVVIDSEVTGSDIVDINKGLRHGTVICDQVSSGSSLDFNGRHVKTMVLAPLPVSGIAHGDISELRDINEYFSLDSNIGSSLTFKLQPEGFADVYLEAEML